LSKAVVEGQLKTDLVDPGLADPGFPAPIGKGIHVLGSMMRKLGSFPPHVRADVQGVALVKQLVER
jgi:hypothetical protein